eukprot:gene6231-6947_t
MDPIIAASFAEGCPPQRKAMASYSHSAVRPRSTTATRRSSNESKTAKNSNEKSCLRFFDPETDYKVRKIVSKVNDSLHLLANEPSLGLYRMQEHVHRSIPNLLERKREIDNNKKKLDGVSYDLDYSISAVDAIGHIRQFANISEALKSAIELKHKLNEREKLEREEKERSTKVAEEANLSISQNMIAEGYICPICYYAHVNQDELMTHWKTEHSLDTYENEVFREILLSTETESDNMEASGGAEIVESRQMGKPSECEEALISEEFVSVEEGENNKVDGEEIVQIRKNDSLSQCKDALISEEFVSIPEI